MTEPTTSRIVIVGGGTAGWMAAAILAPLSRDRYSITLVESEDIGTVGVGEATIPQINLYNQALGIDEDEFVAATKATYKLGIEFVDWWRCGHRYMHAFGDVGRNLGIVPFQHYWSRARRLGVAKGLGHYSLNETAALAGRMERGPLRTTNLLQPMPYAFHFDSSLYAAYLRSIAEMRGAVRHEGRIVDVVRDGESGAVASLQLESGRSIEGDLFVDCSGFRGLLIDGALGTGFEDWSHWLPCDRAQAVACLHNSIGMTPFTRSTAREAGWQWRIPLQDRIGNGYVYSSEFISDEEARDALLAKLEGQCAGEPRLLRFRSGMRAKFWSHNVIAIGLAAGFVEPLESTGIHLVQSALQRLLKLLPRAGGSPAVIEEFNRQTATEFERIRDFLILHYKLTEREDTPFWRRCRDMEVPDTVAEKIALFQQGGHIFRSQDDLFSEVAWLQVLVGQGVVPADYHPMVESISSADLKIYLDSWETLLLREVAQMPPHEAFSTERARAAAS